MAREPALPKDIAGLSFEDALKELEGIVSQLERGQVKLDRKSTRLNSSHSQQSRMPSSA